MGKTSVFTISLRNCTSDGSRTPGLDTPTTRINSTCREISNVCGQCPHARYSAPLQSPPDSPEWPSAAPRVGHDILPQPAKLELSALFRSFLPMPPPHMPGQLQRSGAVLEVRRP